MTKRIYFLVNLFLVLSWIWFWCIKCFNHCHWCSLDAQTVLFWCSQSSKRSHQVHPQSPTVTVLHEIICTCSFFSQSPGSAIVPGALIPLLRKRYLETIIWVLGVLIVNGLMFLGLSSRAVKIHSFLKKQHHESILTLPIQMWDY